jgi:hypothetical protein
MPLPRHNIKIPGTNSEEWMLLGYVNAVPKQLLASPGQVVCGGDILLGIKSSPKTAANIPLEDCQRMKPANGTSTNI